MTSRFLIPALSLFVVSPWSSPAIALALGTTIALAFGNPYLNLTQKLAKDLLPFCIIGLGASMDLNVVLDVGLQGFGSTGLFIGCVLGIGFFLASALNLDRTISILISVGTAICGGSAIAAVAPVVRAKPQEISVSLGIVFLLNAFALVIFPWIGTAFALTERQFGIWAALAIHDTSSVVGATLHYGPSALETGTAVKLARALWIVPLTFLISYVIQSKSRDSVKKPWFILGFLVIAAFVTYVPQLRAPGDWVAFLARKGLVLTLFLIGTNLTLLTLKAIGFRPLLLALILWIFVSASSLSLILAGYIS